MGQEPSGLMPVSPTYGPDKFCPKCGRQSHTPWHGPPSKDACTAPKFCYDHQRVFIKLWPWSEEVTVPKKEFMELLTFARNMLCHTACQEPRGLHHRPKADYKTVWGDHFMKYNEELDDAIWGKWRATDEYKALMEKK
jgi:hypothetical protein